MAALAVEVFEDCAPAAPEVVGEAVDGEPLAEDVDAVGDPELALPVEGDPPELLIELEADGVEADAADGELAVLTPPLEVVGEVAVAGWGGVTADRGPWGFAFAASSGASFGPTLLDASTTLGDVSRTGPK